MGGRDEGRGSRAFVFWVALHILWQETSHERLVHAIAIAVALIPAIVWCLLFRTYQRERLSLVLLLFLPACSTAPILFYDALVRRGAELNFSSSRSRRSISAG